MQATHARSCEHCGDTIPYPPNAGPKGYARRKFCSRSCSHGPRRRPLSERLWEKIAVAGPDECWIWQAAATGNGYGVIGRGERGRGNVCAHIAVYLERVGPIPQDWQVDHLCRVTLCCNPRHLEAVTQQENLRRQAAAAASQERTLCKKGRHPWPESANPTKAGHHYCRECNRENSRKRYLKRRARELAAIGATA